MNQGHMSVHLLQTSLMHIKSSSRCILSLTSHRIPATLANTNLASHTYSQSLSSRFRIRSGSSHRFRHAMTSALDVIPNRWHNVWNAYTNEH